MAENLSTYQKVDELMRVLRSAVREAQAESRRLGVANVYCFDGQLYYELPNGDYTRTPPVPNNSVSRSKAPDHSLDPTNSR